MQYLNNEITHLEMAEILDDVIKRVKALEDKEAAATSPNIARDEICAQIIESGDMCKYCKNDRGNNSTCYSAAIDCSCFIGRKLTPVA